MERFINFELLRNPLNWVIVITMLAIGVMALHLLQPAIGEIGTAGEVARIPHP